MKQPVFTGSGVAIVTPMNLDGSINYDVFADLIEMQIAGGTDALVVCGTTGEASTMTDDEHRECIRFAVEKTAGRIPVIAGTGSNDTAYAIELSVDAEKLGADALLVVTPYYNKSSQRGLVRHFEAIADAVNIPIILYNIPGRTGVNMTIDTFKALSAHKNIVGVKEAGGDMNYFAKILTECDLDVYSGDDSMTVPVMSLGGMGVISVMANIAPDVMHSLTTLCLEDKFTEAGKMQKKYLALMSGLMSDVNPIPVKTALDFMGKKAGPCRLPLIEMEENAAEGLRRELVRYGLV